MTPPISRKLSADSAPAAPAPITSEFSNHTLSIRPPRGSSQRPHLLPLSSFSDKGFPVGGREGSLERADPPAPCRSGHFSAPAQASSRAVPPVGNGPSTVILFEEWMGKACASTGIFICLRTVKPVTTGLGVTGGLYRYQAFSFTIISLQL